MPPRRRVANPPLPPLSELDSYGFRFRLFPGGQKPYSTGEEPMNARSAKVVSLYLFIYLWRPNADCGCTASKRDGWTSRPRRHCLGAPASLMVRTGFPEAVTISGTPTLPSVVRGYSATGGAGTLDAVRGRHKRSTLTRRPLWQASHDP